MPKLPWVNTLLQDFLFHAIGDFDADDYDDEEDDDDDDDDDVIRFSQWTTTD